MSQELILSQNFVKIVATFSRQGAYYLQGDKRRSDIKQQRQIRFCLALPAEQDCINHSADLRRYGVGLMPVLQAWVTI